ncbi:MAG: MgtC/SapB family protein [Lachnospiraceae bacterium]|nr:MgtC/SapB family protein [Lachnospiraceae bacterium]
MGKFISMNDLVYLLRILLAILAGAVIGFEREQRVKVAGLRTHILISMASALMMIISKYAFFDVLLDGVAPGLSLDVSRVAAGIIAGMGIFSGGIVFIGKRGNVSGLTTAAGIWATIGIGMVIGAGMYTVGVGAVILVEIVQFALHHDLAVYRHAIVAIVNFELDDLDSDYDMIVKKLEPYGVKLSSLKWEKTSKESASLKCNVMFNNKYNRDEIVNILNDISEVTSFELP